MTKKRKTPKAAKTPKTAKTAKAAKTPKAGKTQKAATTSVREVVHRCVIRLVGRDAPDDTPISSIPGLLPDDLGGCINDSVPLRGRQRFKRGDIRSSDTLQDVINATTTRKGMQP